MAKAEKISRTQAVFVAIAGLFIGTVFTFGMSYWNASIKYEEAIPTEAVFSDFEVIYGVNFRRVSSLTPNAVRLYFDDGSSFSIDGCCYNDELRKNLASTPSGTEFSMLLHPNSNSVLELRTENRVLLEFNESIEQLSGEKSGFKTLGIVMYVFSVIIFAEVFIHPKNFI